LADAHERIASYSPYGDPVPALRGWAPYIDGIGTGFHFHGVPGSGRIDLHDDPVRHLDFHIRACRIAQLAMTPLLAA